MLELLAAVVGFQYVMAARPAKADAIWMAGDCIAVAQPPAAQLDDTTGP
jgi:hypothetical protein